MSKKQNGQRMSFEFLDCMALAAFTAERVFSILQRFTAQQQIIFGGLPGTLCYVAKQPCSLDSLIFACTLSTVCKKGILESKMGERESKMSESEKQNR